jgi:hypothetical protein
MLEYSGQLHALHTNIGRLRVFRVPPEREFAELVVRAAPT